MSILAGLPAENVAAALDLVRPVIGTPSELPVAAKLIRVLIDEHELQDEEAGDLVGELWGMARDGASEHL
ncbi:MAG: hypothetical protein AB1430_09215 [Pseudomonadota bacterium]